MIKPRQRSRAQPTKRPGAAAAACAPLITTACPDDLADLVLLEERCFAGDRLSRRSLQHLLTRANATVLLVRVDGEPAGYAVVLYRRDSRRARLYSLAVDPAYRGQGLASALIGDAEHRALADDCNAMRLEVRKDNAGALALYRAAGYGPIGEKPDYYEDGEAALCMEKYLKDDVRENLS